MFDAVVIYNAQQRHGHRLARTIRNRTYPKGQDSIDAAARHAAAVYLSTGWAEFAGGRKGADQYARDAERVAGMVPGLIVSSWVEGQ